MLDFKEGKSSKKDAVKYWHAYVAGKRIGYVYITENESALIGKHHLINVFVNKTSQRKGYGQKIFKGIAVLSKFPVLYAKSSKSNIGSHKAALAAGYTEVINNNFKQRVMVWKRS